MSLDDWADGMVTREAARLRPDARRVVTVAFVPGEETPGGDSRAGAITERILAMDEVAVTATLAEVKQRFSHRHRDLEATWRDHFSLVARRFGKSGDVPPERALLIGAYFTREVSVEAAALCNPSMVAHPDQTGLGAGETRFVMSLRALGEGHVSSIEFRTGTINASGGALLDDPGAYPETGRATPGPYEKHLFHTKLAENRCDNNAAALVLDRLDEQFGADQLRAAIAGLHPELVSRAAVRNAVERIRWVAANNYTVGFGPSTTISERVLWPNGPSELHGMEDARFVRFVGDDGTVTYRATYTAFDGSLVAPQLLSTTDFATFVVTQLSGPYATNKGLALFPRKVGGRYLALSRWDRERLAVTVSDDGTEWVEATTLELPAQAWDLVQVGNCGSPLETDKGWLVLTHGVGPMRSYAIGAVLLDLDDPSRVIGTLPGPFVVPNEEEREGYVPNVLYSCGALLHGGSLVMPYGFSDSAVGFALVDVSQLVDRLVAA